jgi:hypothetical protein
MYNSSGAPPSWMLNWNTRTSWYNPTRILVEAQDNSGNRSETTSHSMGGGLKAFECEVAG